MEDIFAVDIEGNGWSKWEKLVLHELKRLATCSSDMDKKIDRIEDMVNANRIKLAGIAAILGFLGGLIPVGIGVLIKVL